MSRRTTRKTSRNPGTMLPRKTYSFTPEFQEDKTFKSNSSYSNSRSSSGSKIEQLQFDSDTTQEEPYLAFNSVKRIVKELKPKKGSKGIKPTTEYQVQWEQRPGEKKYKNTRMTQAQFEFLGNVGYMHLIDFFERRFLSKMVELAKQGVVVEKDHKPLSETGFEGSGQQSQGEDSVCQVNPQGQKLKT